MAAYSWRRRYEASFEETGQYLRALRKEHEATWRQYQGLEFQPIPKRAEKETRASSPILSADDGEARQGAARGRLDLRNQIRWFSGSGFFRQRRHSTDFA